MPASRFSEYAEGEYLGAYFGHPNDPRNDDSEDAPDTSFIELQAVAAKVYAAARPLVALTAAEAQEKEAHSMRFMFCRCDVLNPCWDNRPTDVAGQHWGGGDACDECKLRAAIAALADWVDA